MADPRFVNIWFRATKVLSISCREVFPSAHNLDSSTAIMTHHLLCPTPMLVAPRQQEKEESMEQPRKPLRGELDEPLTMTALLFNDLARGNSSARRLTRPREHATVFDLIKDQVNPEPDDDDKLLSQLLSVSNELVNIHSKKERRRERKEQARHVDLLCSVSRALSELRAFGEEPRKIHRPSPSETRKALYRSSTA